MAVPMNKPDGYHIVLDGGGPFSMRIAKCDATISEVALSR